MWIYTLMVILMFLPYKLILTKVVFLNPQDYNDIYKLLSNKSIDRNVNIYITKNEQGYKVTHLIDKKIEDSQNFYDCYEIFLSTIEPFFYTKEAVFKGSLGVEAKLKSKYNSSIFKDKNSSKYMKIQNGRIVEEN